MTPNSVQLLSPCVPSWSLSCILGHDDEELVHWSSCHVTFQTDLRTGKVGFHGRFTCQKGRTCSEAQARIC